METRNQPMYNFQVTVQRQPDLVERSGEVDLDGWIGRTLAACQLLKPVAMPVSFEQVADRLQRLPRLFFEPDGSFVWVGQEQERRWQVDGQLTDRDGHVVYVELRGVCPAEAFDRLISSFGWPAIPLVFQLTRHAVFLDEDEFRRFAGRPAGRLELNP